jgi:pimeloyl-ACP methyl ester carboxylesterase
MHVISESTVDGVTERHFTIGDIPGVLCTPAGDSGPRPLVLLGHGGGQHKTAPGVVAYAHRYVTAAGFAAVAIDAPAHGDRPRSEPHERFVAVLRERMAAGEPVGEHVERYNAELAARAVPEWQAVLCAFEEMGHGPVGYRGVSLGTSIGIPLVAAEPRISAAVLGLQGNRTLIEAAAGITVPVEFLLQWDDELVPRDAGLAVFDALASREKTLHANTGRHAEVPRFELDCSVRFFLRHLTTPIRAGGGREPSV